MDSAVGPGPPVWVWLLGLLFCGAAAGAGVWWYLRRRRRRVAHFLFTPLPCTFHPATFDTPKCLFDVAWDIGISETGLALLEDLKLLSPRGRLDYDHLNRTLGYYVQQLGGYRNFVYRCQGILRAAREAPDPKDTDFEAPDATLTTYIGSEEQYLEPYVGNPTSLLQNRMVAYLYDNAKTAHARKFGLALAFDYQSFQLLKRCAARDIAATTELLTYSGASAHDKGMRGAQIKAVASGAGVALLETTKTAATGAAAGAAGGAADAAAAATDVITGFGADAAAEVAAEAGTLAARELSGALTLGYIAGQFVPIVQAVVLTYGAVQLGRIVWKKSLKANTRLRERQLRGLQKRLTERLDALHARYETLRDTHTANIAPFAPAHELLALCEFEEQRLSALAADAGGRTGGGDLGLLRHHLCAHAVAVSRGLARGLATHLKALTKETDARLAKGDKAEAALHLFLNKDLVFPPQVLEEIQTQEIAVLAGDVAAEVRRLEGLG